jgi:hypothetical protein
MKGIAGADKFAAMMAKAKPMKGMKSKMPMKGKKPMPPMKPKKGKMSKGDSGALQSFYGD